MSERMYPVSFEKLLNRILFEYENEGHILGTDKNFFWRAGQNRYPIFGANLENAIGPAAGPHTQLAANIVASYLSGSRFFELKTVQTLDGEDLPVAKPCILAPDECYNVEWSTELTVPEAMDEYIKAWVLCQVLARELELGESDGFAFNLSVGYDYDGISSPKIDSFIDGLKDASSTAIFSECKEILRSNLSRFKNVDEKFVGEIPAKVCNSVTLSTLHGCPPSEIERIANHLLTVKKLNTFIKCNPTLLGYETARATLDEMGFDYVDFGKHHFEHDLQFCDAVPMVKRLQNTAADLGLSFGVKLTNTFPVKINNKELPGEEMYMSGRSLLPLSLTVAKKYLGEFGENIRISFSGGADAGNIDKILGAGIWPVTLATTLLKPGGYARLKQIAENSLVEINPTDKVAISQLLSEVMADKTYQKPVKFEARLKKDGTSPIIDCFEAGCMNSCPIEQDIPAYIELAGQSKFAEALEVITRKNPLPFITGTICAHRCMSGCIRHEYDEAVHIRNIKLLCAEQAAAKISPRIAKRNGKSVAVVGAGPAGLSAAAFLARAGFSVTMFDKNEPGGIVANIIPDFRISAETIRNDVAWVLSHGVSFERKEVTAADISGFDYKVIATGAYKPTSIDIGKVPMGCFEFLSLFKTNPEQLSIGKTVCVIGAGNSAMDVARAAKRVSGVENVSIVYRRTKAQMPADLEELELAVKDGVSLLELLAPVSHDGKVLKCEKMKLGERDTSGRRSPVGTGEFTLLPCDTVIVALGEKVDTAALSKLGATQTDGVFTEKADTFIAGDNKKGPATIVEAIADAWEVAVAISKREGITLQNESAASSTKPERRAIISHQSEGAAECERCLGCAEQCGFCVEVCPNRANIFVETTAGKQILHLDALCNECGNCAVFCTYNSEPYRAKFTLYSDDKLFAEGNNPGFVCTQDGVKIRVDGEVFTDISKVDGRVAEFVRAVEKKAYLF